MVTEMMGHGTLGHGVYESARPIWCHPSCCFDCNGLLAERTNRQD